jgi:hypothetical protein
VKVTQERDQLDFRAPLVLGGLTLVILGLSVLFTLGVRAYADRQLASSETELPARARTEVPDRGTQPAWVYERHQVPPNNRTAPPELSSYGWSRRGEGRVHIPIERAKQLYLERERAAAGAGER